MDKNVTNVRIRYFDTLPTAVSLCISKFGMLFAASEFSNQYVFAHRGSVCGMVGGGAFRSLCALALSMCPHLMWRVDLFRVQRCVHFPAGG